MNSIFKDPDSWHRLLFEVEAVIYAHPAVRDVAVFGVPDPNWGETVKACVVLKPGTALTAQELIIYCRRSLAHYKVPRSIEFAESELPKSGSDEILRSFEATVFEDIKRGPWLDEHSGKAGP
jgi:acyl-CoA synthetase (AMP-forming)/AMP-acid ligase II